MDYGRKKSNRRPYYCIIYKGRSIMTCEFFSQEPLGAEIKKYNNDDNLYQDLFLTDKTYINFGFLLIIVLYFIF